MGMFDSDAGSKGLVPSNEALKVDPEPIWTHHLQCFSWLVVDLPLWKIWVNGKDDIPYMKWKIKFMIETTNQF